MNEKIRNLICKAFGADFETASEKLQDLYVSRIHGLASKYGKILHYLEMQDF
jgi:hypothetical protein